LLTGKLPKGSFPSVFAYIGRFEAADPPDQLLDIPVQFIRYKQEFVKSGELPVKGAFLLNSIWEDEGDIPVFPA